MSGADFLQSFQSMSPLKEIELDNFKGCCQTKLYSSYFKLSPNKISHHKKDRNFLYREIQNEMKTSMNKLWYAENNNK